MSMGVVCGCVVCCMFVCCVGVVRCVLIDSLFCV